MRTTLRRHPLVLGTLAAVVALAAATGAAVAVGELTEDDPPERPVDASLRITPEDQESNPLVGEDTTGEAVPATTFPRLGGGLGSLADYRGKPLVLNFWASSCVPCQKEMPDLQEVYEEVGDEVAFLGLAVRDSERDAVAFVEDYGATYDMGRDPSGKLMMELGGLSLPTTVFISGEGKVVGMRPGAVDAPVLRQLIHANLLSS